MAQGRATERLNSVTQQPSASTAPLTRRRAREIERRTGVRPIAVAPTHDFRHDTGEIARNEMDALLSVIPAELVESLAEFRAPAADPQDAVSDAFTGRSTSVRAVAPAELVALRRRRTLSGLAAAASVTALASAGVAGTVTAVSADAHQANLAQAVAAAPAQAAQAAQAATAAIDPAQAPAPEVQVGSSSVTALDAGAVVAAVAPAPATAPAATMGGATAAAATTLHAPIAAGATITDGYGPRVAPLPGVSSFHRGIDLVTGSTCGTPIYAVMSGTVTAAGYNGTYGNTIDIAAADGTKFRFAHLESMNVGVGDTVSGGDVIGFGGTTGASTGCHLHFEVFENGENVDPQAWLVARGLF